MTKKNVTISTLRRHINKKAIQNSNGTISSTRINNAREAANYRKNKENMGKGKKQETKKRNKKQKTRNKKKK